MMICFFLQIGYVVFVIQSSRNLPLAAHFRFIHIARKSRPTRRRNDADTRAIPLFCWSDTSHVSWLSDCTNGSRIIKNVCVGVTRTDNDNRRLGISCRGGINPVAYQCHSAAGCCRSFGYINLKKQTSSQPPEKPRKKCSPGSQGCVSLHRFPQTRI